MMEDIWTMDEQRQGQVRRSLPGDREPIIGQLKDGGIVYPGEVGAFIGEKQEPLRRMKRRRIPPPITRRYRNLASSRPIGGLLTDVGNWWGKAASWQKSLLGAAGVAAVVGIGMAAGKEEAKLKKI